MYVLYFYISCFITKMSDFNRVKSLAEQILSNMLHICTIALIVFQSKKQPSSSLNVCFSKIHICLTFYMYH